MRKEINFTLGRNGGFIPSSLGGRSISMGRQASRQLEAMGKIGRGAGAGDHWVKPGELGTRRSRD